MPTDRAPSTAHALSAICAGAPKGYIPLMGTDTADGPSPRRDRSHPASALEQALRDEGVRITRQRSTLLDVLAKADDHPDATELHRRALALDDSVSLATVYRTLSVLERQGVVNRLQFEGEAARFETTDIPHHDHIIDVDTGDVVEFRSDKIERLQAIIAEELGYEVVRHRMELYCRKLDRRDEGNGGD